MFVKGEDFCWSFVILIFNLIYFNKVYIFIKLFVKLNINVIKLLNY